MTDDITTCQSLAPTDADPETVDEADYPFHDFWCFRETELNYANYRDYLGRQDTPVRIPMDVYDYLRQTLSWFLSINPAYNEGWCGHGLNDYGPTVINHAGGAEFAKVCEGWAQIFAQAPDPLVLTHGMYTIGGEEPPQFRWHQFKVSRDKLVADLTLLAEFGRKAATGEWFILHLGI